MTVVLGKRKRRDRLEDACAATFGDGSPSKNLQALFQQHFEAKFEPLAGLARSRQAEKSVEHPTEEDESDWEGISNHDDNHSVEIVEHTSLDVARVDVPKQELKMFMTAKLPSTIDQIIKPKHSLKPSTSTAIEDPRTESTLLANDLALQRLLRESHLLTPFSQTKSLTLSGSARQKALDLHLQSLGAKSSLFKQEKMPMSHRKGIEARAMVKEEVRRREAKENGIILEKEVKKKGGVKRKRDKGVDAPGMGTFRGGTLKLSRRDVEEIQGSGRGGERRRGRRKGRGGRGTG